MSQKKLNLTIQIIHKLLQYSLSTRELANIIVSKNNLLVVEVEAYQICSPKLKHEKERHEQKRKDIWYT